MTSRSVGRQPLGLRMHKQAEVYNEHKQQLKAFFDRERYLKEMKDVSFHPKLVSRLQV